ncbi:MAG: peptidylprolyl isomerase [Planctomycetaceae bacterium]|nr:peptidylprolyl isomerase [Planctomycetaceae bacterium]
MSAAPTTVQSGVVVGIYYTLRDAQGNEIDSNKKGGKPLAFLVGAGNILPGLEKALIGKSKGDVVKAEVPPAEGYGEPKDELLEAVPRSAFPPDIDLKPGMQFQGNTQDGRAFPVKVAKVEGDQVTIDKNHPLAGQTLFFEVTISGVRAATAEETQHGHPHGPGGHHH